MEPEVVAPPGPGEFHPGRAGRDWRGAVAVSMEPARVERRFVMN